MKTFKTGTPVRLIQPVIEGVIVSGKLSEDGESVDYQVLITAPSGEPFARYFSAEQLAECKGKDADNVLDQHAKNIGTLKKAAAADKSASAKHGGGKEPK